MLPANAKQGWQDRQCLWNDVEAHERRKDAQLARECNVALPIELSNHEQEALIQAWCQAQFVERGMIADINIHRPNHEIENPHAHVMLTMREISNDGEFGKKNRDWNQTEQLQIWRESWEVACNTALKYHYEINHTEEQNRSYVSSKSLAEQGIEREPQIHLGSKIMQIERREQARCQTLGIEYKPVTATMQENEATKERNSFLERARDYCQSQLETIRRQIQSISDQLHNLYDKQAQNRSQELLEQQESFSSLQERFEYEKGIPLNEAEIRVIKEFEGTEQGEEMSYKEFRDICEERNELCYVDYEFDKNERYRIEHANHNSIDFDFHDDYENNIDFDSDLEIEKDDDLRIDF